MSKQFDHNFMELTSQFRDAESSATVMVGGQELTIAQAMAEMRGDTCMGHLIVDNAQEIISDIMPAGSYDLADDEPLVMSAERFTEQVVNDLRILNDDVKKAYGIDSQYQAGLIIEEICANTELGKSFLNREKARRVRQALMALPPQDLILYRDDAAPVPVSHLQLACIANNEDPEVIRVLDSVLARNFEVLPTDEIPDDSPLVAERSQTQSAFSL